jgi:hypothetical protein
MLFHNGEYVLGSSKGIEEASLCLGWRASSSASCHDRLGILRLLSVGLLARGAILRRTASLTLVHEADSTLVGGEISRPIHEAIAGGCRLLLLFLLQFRFFLFLPVNLSLDASSLFPLLNDGELVDGYLSDQIDETLLIKLFPL